MFNAGLFRAPAFPHDSLSSPPSANPTREAGLHTPLSNVWDMQTTCNYLGYKWAVISWPLRTFLGRWYTFICIAFRKYTCKGIAMNYKELIKSGADATDIQQYLVDGEMTAITIRIPKNLRDSAKEVAELRGMSFSTLIRKCMIDELSNIERG